MARIVHNGGIASVLARPQVRPTAKRLVPVSDLRLLEALRERRAGIAGPREGIPSTGEETPPLDP